jgi:hypothetical protein
MTPFALLIWWQLGDAPVDAVLPFFSVVRVGDTQVAEERMRGERETHFSCRERQRMMLIAESARL